MATKNTKSKRSVERNAQSGAFASKDNQSTNGVVVVSSPPKSKAEAHAQVSALISKHRTSLRALSKL